MGDVFLLDAVAQLEALVCHVSHCGHDPVVKLPPPKDQRAQQHLQQAQRLSEGEAWECLRQLALWLASFPADQSAFICRHAVLSYARLPAAGLA